MQATAHSEQPELPLNDKKAVDRADIERLVFVLEINGRWMTAKELYAQTGFDDRKLRVLRSCANGTIVSGNSGYKLTKDATEEELAEYCGRYISQIRAMLDQVNTVRRTIHKREFKLADG